MSVQPRVCVLRAPGTNCDLETCYAFELAGAIADNMHAFELFESPKKLENYQILCIPGGFSYGDDIGAGVIFAGQIQRRLGDFIQEHFTRQSLTLGICNGFQVLLKSGILPDGRVTSSDDMTSPRQATLTWNDNGKYTARWVRLVNDSPQNVFLRDIHQIELPIAHAEGKFCVSDSQLINHWKGKRQIALRYCDETGAIIDELLEESHNPNGSIANIAAIGDESGRVLGLMPHPERFIKATQHPQWTRLNLSGDGDGLKLFQNAVNWFE